MARKRYVVTDMDDTMIVAYGKPTDAVRETWNALNEDEDTCLVVATGQQYMKVKSTFLGNGLALPEYIIADQGTMIYSTKENKALKVYWLTNDEVKPIYDEFFKVGGTMPFVRIYTPELAFAFDCDEAKNFFSSTNQKNVLFGQDLKHIIDNGAYTKIILMNTSDVVDKLVLYSMNANTLMAVNTGKTRYGNCGFYRFELVSSNKKTALEYLLSYTCGFPGNDPVDIICLGDEESDYGLAQVALATNLYSNCTGHFAVVGSGTKGNLQLKGDVEELSKNIGHKDKVLPVHDVKNDGWKEAISTWKEIIK